MEKQLHSTEIKVGGKVYPIKLPDEELQRLPEIQKVLNERISKYKMNYQNLDNVDAISMALISYAFDLSNLKMSADTESVIERIDSLQQLLDKSLI